jgi:hypothetical protein
MLARGRRVALNFAYAVAQRCRDEAIRDDKGCAVTKGARAAVGQRSLVRNHHGLRPAGADDTQDVPGHARASR